MWLAFFGSAVRWNDKNRIYQQFRRNVGVFVAVALLSLAVQAEGEYQDGLNLDESSLRENIKTLNKYYNKLNKKLGTSLPAEGSEKSRQEAVTEPEERNRGFVMAPPTERGATDQGSMQMMLNSGVSQPNIRVGYRQGQRDPFAPTSRLLQVTSSGDGGVQFQALSQATKLPRMHLRGLIQDRNGDLAALLEIEKSGIHIVREGDAVGLYDMGVNSVIRVRKINRLNLVVEAGSLGQMIIVR